jgi:hypothetical protein
MAKVMGKADAFAVAVDDQKCNRIAWMREHMVSKAENKSDNTEAYQKIHPNASSESSYSITTFTTSSAA